MIIHQSLYGDKDGGFALLKTTLLDEKLAKKICNSTDLSDRPGIGVVWEPAIRGFKFEQYFLIMKTYPDNTPGIRQGRVFSHVLIVEKIDLDFISNLSSLFDVFQPQLNKEINIEPFEYSAIGTDDHNLDDRFNKAADSIVNGLTVIWVGQNDFDKLVAIIWKNLSFEMKYSIRFGLSFNPDAVILGEINLVCTPESLSAKWRNGNFSIIEKEEKHIVVSLAGQYLIDRDKSTTLHSFIENLGALPTSINQLKLAEKGLDTFVNIDVTNDFNEIYNLYNIIVAYDGNSRKIIDKVFSKLIDSIPTSNWQSINAFRKLSITDKIKPFFERLHAAIQKWLDKNLFETSSPNSNSSYRLVVNAKSADSEKWWCNIVFNCVDIHFNNWKDSYSLIIWNWLESDANGILSAIGDKLINIHEIEVKLTKNLPSNLSAGTAVAIKAFTEKNKLLLLHAASLLSSQPEDQVLGKQLEVDTITTYYPALQLISLKIKPKIFIQRTLLENDSRLFVIVAHLITKNKKNLADFDITNRKWQIILAISLSEGTKLSSLFTNPSDNIVFPLLDILLKRNDFDIDLLKGISETEFANLTMYSHRSVVWHALPGNLKMKFLEVTANSISKQQQYLDEKLEIELEDVLSSDSFVAEFFKRNSNSINLIVRLINRFPKIPERYLASFLQSYQGNMTVIDAKQLGHTVNIRKWKVCVNIIQTKAGYNNSFKVAFQECCNLLDFVSYGFAVMKGLVTNSKIDQDDWWQSFEQLVCQLYPAGPTENRIWKKAGGDESNLLTRGTGKEIWHDALVRLVQGARDTPSLSELFSKIQKEFPHNSELIMLIKLKLQL